MIYWDETLQWPKLICLEPWKITQNRDKFIEERDNDLNYSLAKLYTAMAMVIPQNGYIHYADNKDDWEGGDHQHSYYDFYHIDFGKAVSEIIEVTTGVAFKKYERGIIAYNRTRNTTILRPQNGTEITINSLEGIFYSLEKGKLYTERKN